MLHLVIVFSVLQFSQGYDVPDFHLTINGTHNATGHWIANVGFQHEDSRSWDIDVQKTTMIWKGRKSVVIEAKIGAPLPERKCTTLEYTNLVRKGYRLLPEFGYYKLHKERDTWARAAEICRAEGAHLLVLNSDEEARKVGVFTDLPSVPGKDCWLGVHDMFIEGHYVTIFDEPLSTIGFSKWDSNKPSNAHNRDCLDYTYDSAFHYGMGHYFCDNTDEFICEKELC